MSIKLAAVFYRLQLLFSFFNPGGRRSWIFSRRWERLPFFFLCLAPRFDILFDKKFGDWCLVQALLCTLCCGADGQGPSCNKPLASTSLIHEFDLAVSFSDLDKIFNSDEDELTVSASVWWMKLLVRAAADVKPVKNWHWRCAEQFYCLCVHSAWVQKSWSWWRGQVWL